MEKLILTPKAGQIIAVHSHGFIPESIQLFEKIQELREGEYDKKDISINHIAGIITDKDGDLAVCEMDSPGCIITKWVNSRYYRNECLYLILSPIEFLTPLDILDLSIMGRNDEGKVKYDFMGIGYQIVYTAIGWWLGATGQKAGNRFFCSEQWATYFYRKLGWFKKCYWKINPQDFFESDLFKIVGGNFDPKTIQP